LGISVKQQRKGKKKDYSFCGEEEGEAAPPSGCKGRRGNTNDGVMGNPKKVKNLD